MIWNGERSVFAAVIVQADEQLARGWWSIPEESDLAKVTFSALFTISMLAQSEINCSTEIGFKKLYRCLI